MKRDELLIEILQYPRYVISCLVVDISLIMLYRLSCRSRANFLGGKRHHLAASSKPQAGHNPDLDVGEAKIAAYPGEYIRAHR